MKNKSFFKKCGDNDRSTSVLDFEMTTWIITVGFMLRTFMGVRKQTEMQKSYLMPNLTESTKPARDQKVAQE
jgi:hypothetical protein